MVHVQNIFDISVRVSQQGKRDLDRLYSPDVQETASREKIASLGADVGIVVSEMNVSGGKAAKSRGIEKLVKRVESGESQGIMVYDFSRFSREEPFAAMALVGRIHAAGGRVLGVTDSFDSASPMGAVHAAILATQSHSYLTTARERSKSGAKRAKELGRYCGQTPKGYDREDGRLVINEYEADTVRGLFNGCLAGWSWRQMQTYAAERGMKITFGGLKAVLHNPVYIGQSRGGQSPRILDDETFERVQQAKPKRPAYGKAAQTALVQGLAVCASCGKTLVLTPNSRNVVSYYCKGRSIDGCASRGCISQKMLDPYVEQVFLGAFKGQGPLARAYADDRALIETGDLLRTAEFERDQLLSNSSLLAQLGDRAAKVLGDADAKVEMAQSAYNEAKRQADTLGGVASMIDDWQSGKLTIEEKRRLLAKGVARVEVANGRVQVANKTRVIFHGEVTVTAPDDAGALLPLVEDRDVLALNIG